MPFPRNVLAFFMRFHSIHNCYDKIIVRAPINLREFFRDFLSDCKEKEGRGEMMNLRKTENC